MARKDAIGLFWEDEPKSNIKRIKPEPLWLKDDYLPGLDEAKIFNIDSFTNQELYDAFLNKEPFVFDIECYENYFLVAFKSVITRKVIYWEMTSKSKINIDSLLWFITNFNIISFNGIKYDIPILTLALNNKKCEVLKNATNLLINHGLRPNDILKQFKCSRLKNINHIDLIEVAPLSASLKMYAGRLHCRKMQDLPFDPDKVLNDDQIAIIRLYCINDLDNTILLYDSLKTELNLRNEMTSTYRIDLRSKSDAQIAEAVIRTSLEKRNSCQLQRPTITPGRIYNYHAPKFLKYESPLMQWVLNLVTTTQFITSDKGKVALPDILAETPIKIGLSTYKLGIGGLHSTEKTQAYHSDENYIIKDVDVESYYPRIILNLGLFPEQLGRSFLSVYNDIVETRIQAKRRASEIKKEIADLKKLLD